MATPALRARLPTPAAFVDVLYTDAPLPAMPSVLLKTLPVAGVTVARDPVFAAGGARLLVVTLADGEVAPRRRFAFRARLAAGVSGLSGADVVPAQLTDADGALLYGATGDPLIPAPTPRVAGQLLDIDGEPLYDADGEPLFPAP